MIDDLIELVSIPGGSFLMGSPEGEYGQLAYEGSQHLVSVPSFLMGKYPVTQAQWQAVAALPRVRLNLDPDPSYFKGDSLPVESISWYDAQEFCARISAHTGNEYRLPSEAEWEYACRAGTTTPFSFGNSLTKKQANFDGDKTVFVGKFPPNAFSLHDMHGNVWEWCQDHWHNSYDGAPDDGSAWVEGGDAEYRIVRGGSWFSGPRLCCSAHRDLNDPVDLRDFSIGFRVACSAPMAL